MKDSDTFPLCSFCMKRAVNFDPVTHLMHCENHPSESLPEIWFDPTIKWLTTKEMSRVLKVHPNSVINWRSEGRLERMGIAILRIGKTWRYGISHPQN